MRVWLVFHETYLQLVCEQTCINTLSSIYATDQAQMRTGQLRSVVVSRGSRGGMRPGSAASADPSGGIRPRTGIRRVRGHGAAGTQAVMQRAALLEGAADGPGHVHVKLGLKTQTTARRVKAGAPAPIYLV